MKPTILFVDDEEAVLEGIQRMLRAAPFTIVTAGSSTKALQVLATTEVDVIVCDECMPGVSGTELLCRMRRSHPNIVRIALTGGADLQKNTRFISEAQLYRFLSKPLDRFELVRTLEQAVNVKRTAQESARLREGTRGRDT